MRPNILTSEFVRTLALPVGLLLSACGAQTSGGGGNGTGTGTGGSTTCVETVLCVQGDHWDTEACACVPDVDAGVEPGGDAGTVAPDAAPNALPASDAGTGLTTDAGADDDADCAADAAPVPPVPPTLVVIPLPPPGATADAGAPPPGIIGDAGVVPPPVVVPPAGDDAGCDGAAE